MEEIIGDNHLAFYRHQLPKAMSDVRHQIYHDAYNKYGSATVIQRYLMEKYNFKVNQSTIYYAWYKIKEKQKERTARQFIDTRFGVDAYKDTNIELLMMDFACYQLSLHVDNEYKSRFDIKNKIEELNKFIDEHGYRQDS